MPNNKHEILLNDGYKTTEKLYGASDTKKNELLVFSKGELLYRGFNTVVNNGRFFNIQTLVQSIFAPSTTALMQTGSPNRYLRCWGTGTDGTVSGDYSTPKAVVITETDLSSPVPFTTSLFTHEDDDSSKPLYRDNRKKKEFAAVSVIHDTNTEEIYAELEFSITELELNGYNISEIGFYLYDGNSDASNYQLFSKVNIPAIFKQATGSLTASYDFKYRIYV